VGHEEKFSVSWEGFSSSLENSYMLKYLPSLLGKDICIVVPGASPVVTKMCEVLGFRKSPPQKI
jgi:hypothetical protein